MDDESTVTLTRAEYDRLRPTWAKSAILAQLERDESDLMTDYHGSRTEQTVVIGWSRHERDLFPEMRQAAQLFPPTAHLGPGRDIYTPRVVFVNDIQGNGIMYWPGSYSPWHRELYGDFDPPRFTTLAEAEAFVARAGEPEPVSYDGQTALFRWDIERQSVEHREKWSMGHGYYLAGRGGKYSGWQVRKGNESWMLQGDRITVAAHLTKPRAAHTSPQAPTLTGATFTENPSKGGVELRFPAKPAASVLDDLKGHGWRWSRFSACWYHRDCPEARTVAARIVGAPVPEGDEGHAPDLDRMLEDAAQDITRGPWEE